MVDRRGLIALARRIERTDDPVELGRLVARFDHYVPHPAASDLFFFPELEFGVRTYPGAEAVVDAALAYEDPFADDRGCAPRRRRDSGQPWALDRWRSP